MFIVAVSRMTFLVGLASANVLGSRVVVVLCRSSLGELERAHVLPSIGRKEDSCGLQ
jgi:hypothetical protein